MRRAALPLLLLGCPAEPAPPPIDALDGNVVAGDATPADRGLDLGPGDATPDAEPGDADPADGGPADLGLDASGPDDLGVLPCAATTTVVLDVTTLLDDAMRYRDRLVEVRGRVGAGPSRCTKIACGAANPCCNRCDADVELDGRLPLLAGTCTASVGCTGSECALSCTPPIFGFERGVRGWVRIDGRVALELLEVVP